MKNNHFFIALISFSLLACNSSTKKEEPVATDSTLIESNYVHQHSESDSLQLNNGNKWKVDEHMMVFLQNMQNDAKKHDRSNPSKNRELAVLLQLNLDSLTTNCTMKGSAHDELHKWLLPFMDLVNDLKNAESEKESTELLNRVNKQLTIFNQYFE